MRPALKQALEGQLGRVVRAMRPLSGGDINEAFAVELETGERIFVKTHPRAPEGLFGCEARGLAWLAEAQALRVPEVLAWSDAQPAFLALELLPHAPRRADYDEQLGRGLAHLHCAHPTGFGLDHDNFIGSLPQDNQPTDTWAELYRRRRLEPQLRMAQDAGLASARMRQGLSRLMNVLETRVGPVEPPARLHGDLWSGNVYVDGEGRPCLIDPAVYGGHREVDLAMMRLFGGFDPNVFASYEEAYPLAPGHEERVPLYQLYPLLVHVNLFGGAYVGAVERALARVA